MLLRGLLVFGLVLLCGWVRGAADEQGQEQEQLAAVAGLVALLGQVDDADFQLDLLTGLHEALRGRRGVAMPDGWREVFVGLERSERQEVRQKARILALIFNDSRALESLRQTALDEQAPVAVRQSAVEALRENSTSDLAPLFHQLLGAPELRGAALRGLAAQSHAETPPRILELYPQLDQAEQQDALHTLASRPEFALALLEAIGQGRIARHEVSAFTARQLESYGDERISRELRQVWGTVRPTSEQRREQIAQYKQWLTPAALEDADPSRGRAVFQRLCHQCHKLYGTGGSIGPDLTGSNRDNLDYVLENIVDPSAAVAQDYQMTTVVTGDGRVLSGILQPQPNDVVALQTPSERILLPVEAIEQTRPSSLSIMPEGLFDDLAREQIRDLVAYLATRRQVPLDP